MIPSTSEGKVSGSGSPEGPLESRSPVRQAQRVQVGIWYMFIGPKVDKGLPYHDFGAQVSTIVALGPLGKTFSLCGSQPPWPVADC